MQLGRSYSRRLKKVGNTRFSSGVPRLDMLTLQLNPLSKPVGPNYITI